MNKALICMKDHLILAFSMYSFSRICIFAAMKYCNRMDNFMNHGRMLELFRTSQVRCRQVIHHFSPAGAQGGRSARPYPSIVWLKQGRVRTHTDPPGTPPLLREENSVVYHPANRRKQSEFLSEGVTEFVAVTLSCEIASGIDFLGFLTIPTLLKEETAAGMRELLTRLLKLPPFPEEATDIGELIEYREIALALFRLLLTEAGPGEQRPEFSELDRLLPVMEYIARHYTRTLRVEQLAELARLSRPQFHRQFKALTGLSPFEYIKRKRMRQVEFLLIHSDLTIAEIGREVGWEDQFHLSRLFKELYGVPPLTFRKNRKLRGDLLI